MLKVYRLGKHHSTNPDTEATTEWLSHWEPLRGRTTIRELLAILKPYEDCLPLYRRIKLHKFANLLMEAWARKGKITAKVDEYGNPIVSIIPEKEFIALQMLMAEHKTIIRTL